MIDYELISQHEYDGLVHMYPNLSAYTLDIVSMMLATKMDLTKVIMPCEIETKELVMVKDLISDDIFPLKSVNVQHVKRWINDNRHFAFYTEC